MKKVREIVVLGILILVVTLAIVSFASAGTNSVGTKKLVEPSISIANLQGLLPDVTIRMEKIQINDPTVVEVYGANTINIYLLGKPPEFKSENENKEWFDKLVELAKQLSDPNFPFSSPNEPVVLHGAGADGYFHVGFEYDMPFTEAMMEEIANVVYQEAEKIGFNGEVPITFGRAGPTGVDVDRTSQFRPTIGGIEIQNRDQGYTLTSTLGWSATRNGVNGFVVAGHLGYNRPTQLNSTIYQPTYPNYPTGNVNAVGGSFADVAWVPFSNVAAKIYFDSGIIVSVNFYQEPVLNHTVYMSGLTSGLVSGTVKYLYVDVSHPIFGTLRRQVLANYPRASGDSGAPVYEPVSGYGRGMEGIHWGYTTYNGQVLAAFSPCSGVNTDTGAVPMTTWP